MNVYVTPSFFSKEYGLKNNLLFDSNCFLQMITYYLIILMFQLHQWPQWLPLLYKVHLLYLQELNKE